MGLDDEFLEYEREDVVKEAKINGGEQRYDDDYRRKDNSLPAGRPRDMLELPASILDVID